MNTLKQILGNKEQAIWSITPQETVFEAIQLMADKRIGALLVMDNDTLCGIFSERDYAREVILKGRSSQQTPIKEVMTTNVISVPPGQRVSDSLQIMTTHRIRHLPVVESDRVVGIVSIGDLVKEIINEQQQTISQLENYIKG